MASKYGSKLSKLGKSWDKAREEFGDSTGGFETVPSGNYVVGKVHVELDEDKEGRVRIKREQVILEGDHQGFKLVDRMNLDESIAPRGMEFLLKWLNLLGYKIESITKDLEETLDAINGNQGATFQVTIKENNGFNNVFYNKMLEEGEQVETASTTETVEAVTSRGALPDIDTMSARKLKKLVADEGLKIEDMDDMSEDDLRDAIEKAWKKKEPPKEESAPKRRAAKKSDDQDKDEDEELRKKLYDLGDAFGIEVNKDDDLATIKKTLGEFTFKKAELDTKEVALLEKAGLKSIIR